VSAAIDRCLVGVIGRPVDPEDEGPEKRAQLREEKGGVGRRNFM